MTNALHAATGINHLYTLSVRTNHFNHYNVIDFMLNKRHNSHTTSTDRWLLVPLADDDDSESARPMRCLELRGLDKLLGGRGIWRSSLFAQHCPASVVMCLTSITVLLQVFVEISFLLLVFYYPLRDVRVLAISQIRLSSVWYDNMIYIAPYFLKLDSRALGD